jgi:FkbM family methyltransferase
MIVSKAVHTLGRAFQRTGTKLLSYKGLSGIWIDVGCHLGEKTLRFARQNPSLIVYAFEPNLKLVSHFVGVAPNFVIIPMAVAEYDGCGDFYINAFDAASSLIPFNPEGLQRWIGWEQLRVERKVSVPVIRLDTFMSLLRIPQIDFLKIDAQGADLSVIKSAGKRLTDIRLISLEVATTPIPLYVGAPKKDEIVEYLENARFVLVDSEEQSYGQEQNLTFVQAS